MESLSFTTQQRTHSLQNYFRKVSKVTAITNFEGECKLISTVATLYPFFSRKIMKQAKEWGVAHKQEKKQLMETVSKEAQRLDLLEKRLKSLNVNMCKKWKKTISKELQKSMRTVSHQIKKDKYGNRTYKGPNKNSEFEEYNNEMKNSLGQKSRFE